MFAYVLLKHSFGRSKCVSSSHIRVFVRAIGGVVLAHHKTGAWDVQFDANVKGVSRVVVRGYALNSGSASG